MFAAQSIMISLLMHVFSFPPITFKYEKVFGSVNLLIHQIMVIVRSVVSTHLMDKKVKGDYSKTSIHNQQFRDQNQFGSFAMFGMNSNHSEWKQKDNFKCE